jgi:hypothetical protein
MLSKGGAGTVQPPTPPVPPADSAKYIRLPVDSATVQKVIILKKSGTWQEFILN